LTRFKKEKNITTPDYSPGIKLLNFLAPPAAHTFASFLIVSRITMDGACLLFKTLVFIFFQISEVTRSASEATVLRVGMERRSFVATNHLEIDAKFYQ
jgi:hypothetical protein